MVARDSALSRRIPSGKSEKIWGRGQSHTVRRHSPKCADSGVKEVRMSTIQRRIRGGFLAAALAAVAVFGAALPAAAHDPIVSTTPTEGETLTVVPETIVFEVAGEVSDNPAGLAAEIIGTDGSDWTSGAPTVEGFTVSIPVKPEIPSDTYTVTVQFVSSDGHPTNASLTFTLELAETEPSPTAEPTEDAVIAPTTQAPTQAPNPDAPADNSTNVLLWAIIGAVVLGIMVVVIVAIAVRRKNA